MKWIALWLALAGCDQVFGLERPPEPTGPWQSVAAGSTQTCAIKLDGTLWCWGTMGEIVEVPAQIGDARWRTISTRFHHACGIQEDATLWCWGDNLGGQLGTGAPLDEAAPTQIPGAWIAVSTGEFSTCAIRDTGVLACWGTQIGSNPTTSALTPSDLAPGIAGWTVVEVGDEHACALRDGELWCWGDPRNGLVGDESLTMPIATPVRIGSDLWSQLSVAPSHTCAIRNDGRLACWGGNRRGQLGDGSRVNSFAPALIGDAADWTAVVTGTEHTCGVRDDDSLWCWGDNAHGKHGSATSPFHLTPVEVPHVRSWASVALGPDHVCAIDVKSRLYCAGSRASGQLGDGTTHELAPVMIEGTTWTSLSLRGSTACALDARGVPHCWGQGLAGQIGDGASESRQIPTRNGPSGGRMITVGLDHACALRGLDTRDVWCWGAGSTGQLGNGSTADAPLPVQVNGSLEVAEPRHDRVSAGGHTCAIDGGHKLTCWGRNGEQQLGVSYVEQWPIPIDVNATLWREVSAGRSHTCGIDVNFVLWCWGYVNRRGTEETIKQVITPFEPTSVAVASQHTCIWKTGGQAACWGDNSLGAVGTGTPISSTPNVLPFTWHHLAVGESHTCGITAGRALFCWGDNAHGQLGTSTRDMRGTPTQVGTDQDWDSVAAGEKSSCALKMNGTLWCWGDNSSGQLGNERSWRSELLEVP